MTAAKRVDETMMQAYVDGRLPDQEVRLVEDHLAASPDDAARAARYIAQRDALRAALQAKFDEPVPTRLTVAGIRAERRRRATLRYGSIAAMLAIAIVAGVAAWIAAPHGGDALVADAESARSGSTAPERSADADTLATPDARDRMVADTLDTPAKVPDLSRAGFRLSGITVLKDHQGGPALQIAYRDAGGRIFTLYLDRSKGADRFDLMQDGTMRICVWQNDKLSVVMLGEMPTKEMLKVATMTYADLEF